MSSLVSSRIFSDPKALNLLLASREVHLLKYSFFGFFLIFICFQGFMQNLGFAYFRYFDEVLLFIFIGMFFLKTLIGLKIFKFDLLILFSYCFLFISSFFFGYNKNPTDVLLQSLIHLKFFIFLSGIYQLTKSDRYDLLKRIFQIILILSFIGLFFHFLLGPHFNALFNIPVNYRAGSLRIGGFFGQPNLLGLFLSLTFLWISLKEKRKFLTILFLSSIFLIVLLNTAQTRTALIAIPFVLYFSLQNMVVNWNFKIISIMSLTLILFISGLKIQDSELMEKTKENVVNTINGADGGYIRGIMMYNAIQLSMEHFPYGTGAATFGSVLSKNFGEVYEMVGLHGSIWLEEGKGIYDSNLASILGEFGLIGVGVFLLLISWVYNFFKRLLKKGNLIFMKSVLIFVVLSSIVNPVFMHGGSSVLFTFFLIVGSIDRDKKNI